MHAPGMRVAKVLIIKGRDGFGHDDVRLATIEEIRGVVPDCTPGSIPPFGALYGLRTFVDNQLLTVPEVTVPAGNRARRSACDP
jgi:Ala-tRNA(Pro) deacylase